MLQWHAGAAVRHGAGRLHTRRRTWHQPQTFSGAHGDVYIHLYEMRGSWEGEQTSAGRQCWVTQRNHSTTAMSWLL